MADAADDLEITTMGDKGQVVIPKNIRERLGLGTRAKFVVFGRGDTILLKRLTVPGLEKEFVQLFDDIKRRGLHLTDGDVAAEVKAYRQQRRRRK